MSFTDKNSKNSYSDLFEDFFRSDAQDSMASVGTGNQDLFGGRMGVQNGCGMVQGNFGTTTNDSTANELFLQYQQQQLQYQQQFAAYFNTLNSAQQMAFQYPVMPSTNTTSIARPGFVRNRTRKNMRQKSVANAVKANHLMNSVNSMGMGMSTMNFPIVQQNQVQAQIYQQSTPQIPYYQQAAQIPMYQGQMQAQGHGQVTLQAHNQQQAPPVLLFSKSPIAQPVQSISPNVSHPQSPSSRSPTSNSSDYVKMRLQQKIRSRMVSKGQIPPNPTDEELRMCGIQIPIFPIPTPNSSPQQQQQQQQQIPRTLNNNITSNNNNNSRKLSSDSYPVVPIQQEDEIMKYFDMNDVNYSQRDPLLHLGLNDSINNNFNNFRNQPTTNSNFKQQQQQQIESIYPPVQQFQSDLNLINGSTTTSTSATNYDQFFSDFILY